MFSVSDSTCPLPPLKRIFPPSRSLFLPFFPILLSALALCLTTCEETILKPQPGMTDTTTHDWRFEVDTIGGPYSGVRDVVAYSKDDAWIAGCFWVYPDPGNLLERTLYNLAHWDGRTWTLMRIFTQRPWNPPDDIGEGESLAALPDRNIILTMTGGDVLRTFGGKYWYRVSLPPDVAPGTRYWVKSQNEIYLADWRGRIYCWNGALTNGTAKRFETNTTTPLTDIYGDEEEVYACGRNSQGSRSVVLKKNGDAFQTLDTSRSDSFFQAQSVWYCANGDVFAVCGYPNTISQHGKLWYAIPKRSFNPYYMTVRGSAPNNIWFAGHFLAMAHFNGSTFRFFENITSASGQLKVSWVGDDFLFAVGYQAQDNGVLSGIVIRSYKNR